MKSEYWYLLGIMAALSHIKNRKEAKSRENIEQIIQKCANPSGDVCRNTFIGLLRLEIFHNSWLARKKELFFSKSHVQLDPKEQLRLDKIVDDSGFIKRDEFVEFAKKSASVKDFQLRGSRSSTPVGRREIDKAEVVFRVSEGTFV